jgi:hypothetical protein
VIDPRTGWALTSRVTAVVQAATGMLSDAAATAVTVLDSASAERFAGGQQGLRVIKRTQWSRRAEFRDTLEHPSCASQPTLRL